MKSATNVFLAFSDVIWTNDVKTKRLYMHLITLCNTEFSEQNLDRNAETLLLILK